MKNKTDIELALSSISWQLKRIADSLENIEDGNLITQIRNKPKDPSKLKQMLEELKNGNRS